MNYNTLQALMLDSHTLTLVYYKHDTYSPNKLCIPLTSRHLHTLALDSISLYTLATYGTHFTTSHSTSHTSVFYYPHSLHKFLTPTHLVLYDTHKN